MLSNIKNGIENLQVGMANAATLTRHAVLDLLILSSGDLRLQIYQIALTDLNTEINISFPHSVV